MASNWIKLEVITPDKPEIFRLAEILNIAYQSLDSKGDNDSEFILPIMELTKQGLTPGDTRYKTGKVVNG